MQQKGFYCALDVSVASPPSTVDQSGGKALNDGVATFFAWDLCGASLVHFYTCVVHFRLILVHFCSFLVHFWCIFQSAELRDTRCKGGPPLYSGNGSCMVYQMRNEPLYTVLCSCMIDPDMSSGCIRVFVGAEAGIRLPPDSVTSSGAAAAEEARRPRPADRNQQASTAANAAGKGETRPPLDPVRGRPQKRPAEALQKGTRGG